MAAARSGAILDWSRDEIFAHVRGARREVLLCSPFISAEIAGELVLRGNASKATRFRLLTCLSHAATANGVLDPGALSALLDAKWELKSGRNLHAKVALVDRSWAVVGSGNLTVRGLGGADVPANAELGVLLTKPQVRRALRVVEEWWEEATPVDHAEVEECPPPRRGRGQRGKTVGANLGKKSGKDLKGRRVGGRSTGLWLKMVYDRTDRFAPQWWKHHKWVSDRHLVRPDGKVVRRPSYECGDLLLLYVVGRTCPAIVEVTRTAEYEPERVRDDPDSLPDDWARWGWVTEVKRLHSAPIAVAPTLEEIGVAHSSVRQHGHIKLGYEQFARARSLIQVRASLRKIGQ